MAAPLFAGFIARINQTVGYNVGFVNSVFYNNPDAFNDITPVDVAKNNVQSITGNGFMTTVGWDATTGLGSPKGASVLALFQNLAANIQVKTGTSTWSTVSNVSVKTNSTTWTEALHVYVKTAPNIWKQVY